eukprot:476435-Hanusia_phi.AAC.2
MLTCQCKHVAKQHNGKESDQLYLERSILAKRWSPAVKTAPASMSTFREDLRRRHFLEIFYSSYPVEYFGVQRATACAHKVSMRQRGASPRMDL